MDDNIKYNFLIEKLDNDIVPRRFVEHNNCIYIFYISKKYFDSGFDDRYRLIGQGPIIYNKANQSFTKTGYLEFLEKHFDPNVFEEYKEDKPSFDEIKANFVQRKHINFEEFEWIMEKLNIDIHNVRFITEDDQFIEMTSENEEDIKKFISLFQEIGFQFEIKSSNQIILDNGSFVD